jgi:hypothetical protein
MYARFSINGVAEPLLGPSGPSGHPPWPTPEEAGGIPTREPPKKQQASRKTAALMAAVFGMINSVVAIPAMISFTAIIYQVCCLFGRYGRKAGQFGVYWFLFLISGVLIRAMV